MQAIQTEYNDYLFRSRLEARWAVFFDMMHIRWEYEPEGLILSDGSFYLPDFYLPDFHVYFEVKRAGLKDTDEGKEAIRKISDGIYNDSFAGLICFGDPVDDNLTLFCQEEDDGGGGLYDGTVTIGIHPLTKDPCLLSYCDYRERSFFDTWEHLQTIPCITAYSYNYSDFINAYVLDARRVARQARFEHGEKPVIGKR